MLAQGEYVYLQNGEPAGLPETWELTLLPDGSRINRVEVGESIGLWHLMVAPDGRPDRLQVRLRDEVGRRFDATYTFFDQEVIVAAGQVGERPRRHFVELPAGFGLVWVPFAGRDPVLMGCGPEVEGAQSVMLYVISQEPREAGWLSGNSVACLVERRRRSMLEVPAGSFDAEEIVITIPGHPDQRGWFDRHGTVLQWQVGGQTRAVLLHYRRFDVA
ncbi:MAG: hypothetical protein D6791_07190 [Chloroflexi bacterium]|nr:MAG: hypothetical protein D6791_07190 [Chloroflexota bacterium]